MANDQQETDRQQATERERESEGGMQRCPYLHEMRERLLDQPRETLQLENMERANLLDNRQSASESHQVGTVVKVGAVGCTRTKDSNQSYAILSPKLTNVTHSNSHNTHIHDSFVQKYISHMPISNNSIILKLIN